MNLSCFKPQKRKGRGRKGRREGRGGRGKRTRERKEKEWEGTERWGEDNSTIIGESICFCPSNLVGRWYQVLTGFLCSCPINSWTRAVEIFTYSGLFPCLQRWQLLLHLFGWSVYVVSLYARLPYVLGWLALSVCNALLCLWYFSLLWSHQV